MPHFLGFWLSDGCIHVDWCRNFNDICNFLHARWIDIAGMLWTLIILEIFPSPALAGDILNIMFLFLDQSILSIWQVWIDFNVNGCVVVRWKYELVCSIPKRDLERGLCYLSTQPSCKPFWRFIPSTSNFAFILLHKKWVQYSFIKRGMTVVQRLLEGWSKLIFKEPLH